MSSQDKKSVEMAQDARTGDQFHGGRLALFGIIALILAIGAIVLSRMI